MLVHCAVVLCAMALVLPVPCFGGEPASAVLGTTETAPASCGDGTCDEDEDNCNCPQDCEGECPTGLPDLVYSADAVNAEVVSWSFVADDCAVQEGCASAGDRKLLWFTAEVWNIGSADLALGDPVDNPLFVYNACFDHYQFEQFGQWRLVDDNGLVATGVKPYFCLSDHYRHDANANVLSKYYCRNQGVQAGWADVYSAGLACQWIDVTDIPPGDYTLELEVNYELLLPESDYSNNITSVPVTIPAGEVERPCGSALLTLVFGSGLWVWFRLVPFSFGGRRPQRPAGDT